MPIIWEAKTCETDSDCQEALNEYQRGGWEIGGIHCLPNGSARIFAKKFEATTSFVCKCDEPITYEMNRKEVI